MYVYIVAIVTIVLLSIVAAISKRRSALRKWSPKGKVSFITGASSGIGRDIALQLAQKGSNIVAVARRTEELQTLVKQCEEFGVKATFVTADLSKRDECEKAVQKAVEVFGGIDLAVLNAGLSMTSQVEDLVKIESINHIMDINFYGVVHCLHYALPYLKRSSSPRVAVVSSLMGKFPLPFRSVYCASKFALHGYFGAFRIEVEQKYNMLVTIICPGVVNTEIHSRRIGGDGTLSKYGFKSGPQNMSSEECARQSIDGIVHGKREVVMTAKGKLAVFLYFFFPHFIDRLLEKFERNAVAASKSE